MRIKHLFIPVIAATLVLSACGGAAEPPAPPPAPTGPTQADCEGVGAAATAAITALDAGAMTAAMQGFRPKEGDIGWVVREAS